MLFEQWLEHCSNDDQRAINDFVFYRYFWISWTKFLTTGGDPKNPRWVHWTDADPVLVRLYLNGGIKVRGGGVKISEITDPSTSGHFCWPPTGSSYWPLTPASGRGDDLSRGRLRRDAVPARSDDEPVHPSRGAGCSVLGARGGRPRSDATWFGVVGQGEADPRGVIAVRANGFPA